jgi:hypothetical protein
MKNKWWIILAMLVAAFSFIAVGCGDSDDGDDSSNGGGGIPPGDGSGVIVVMITTEQDWAGVDLMDSHFLFATGDVISGKGRLISGTFDPKYVDSGAEGVEIVFQDKIGAWGTPVYQFKGGVGLNWNCNNVSLTGDMITNIAAGKDMQGIRIQGNNVVAKTLKFTIEELTVKRGTETLLDLKAYWTERNFVIGYSDFGDILPGDKGFQKAGNATALLIERPL